MHREEVKERLWANLTKGRSGWTRSWYNLWLVNFDIFCQHCSKTDADESYDLFRDLSTIDAVFKSVVSNMLKDFPLGVPLWRREGLHKNVVSGRLLFILPTSYLSTLFTSNISDEWKSRCFLHDFGGLCSSWGHNEIPIWTVKQNQRCSNGSTYWQRSHAELESARLCVNTIHDI